MIACPVSKQLRALHFMHATIYLQQAVSIDHLSVIDICNIACSYGGRKDVNPYSTVYSIVYTACPPRSIVCMSDLDHSLQLLLNQFGAKLPCMTVDVRKTKYYVRQCVYSTTTTAK